MLIISVPPSILWWARKYWVPNGFPHNVIIKKSQITQCIGLQERDTTYKGPPPQDFHLDGHVLKYKSYKVTAKAIPKEEGSLVTIKVEYQKLKAEDAPPNNYVELLANLLEDIDAHIMKTEI
ncbi:hypothetical protein Tsubulata_021423 [Turnera subulata]|uniref:Bet v I/Major latex protein domain-containing protein n=1 Tax=Turnera subulata TaxID=218843 RepID=A0A9Q0FZ58_9ROSI|nr:hypothetical protein Tsubulata_021423 [Turnera subulata]